MMTGTQFEERESVFPLKFKVSVSEYFFYKQDNLIFFSPALISLFVIISPDWAVVYSLLIVQCHLVTADMDAGKNCQRKTFEEQVAAWSRFPDQVVHNCRKAALWKVGQV